MSPPNAQIGAQRTNLLRYVARHVDDSVLREDIVQEAYLRLLTYQAQPGNKVSNVPALLRRISLNLTRDHFRRSRRLSVVELSEETPCSNPSIQQQLEQRELIELVAGILKAMPRLRREVFVRRRVHGQSTQDVADALELSIGAVNTHVARAVLDLHLAIEKIEKRGGPVTR